MHPNPIFRKTVETHSIALLKARSFGTLVVSADPVPLIAHVPFLLDVEAGYADLHLVRSNPIARAAKEAALPAKIAVTGPDSYVSPDWYEVADQVPTWNYVAVHLTGHLEMLPQDDLHGLLDRQSAHFEKQLAPKPEWTSAKMSDGVMDKMMRAIAPFRFHITDIDSTWKLGQNKPDVVRETAAAHMKTTGIGSDVSALSDLMAAPPPSKG